MKVRVIPKSAGRMIGGELKFIFSSFPVLDDPERIVRVPFRGNMKPMHVQIGWSPEPIR